MKKKLRSFLTTLIPQLISNPLLALLYTRNVSERRRPLTYHQFNHMAFSLYSPAFYPDILKLFSSLIPVIFLFSGVS